MRALCCAVVFLASPALAWDAGLRLRITLRTGAVVEGTVVAETPRGVLLNTMQAGSTLVAFDDVREVEELASQTPQPGDQVVARTRAGTSVEGALVGETPRGVLIRTSKQTTLVPRTELVELRLRPTPVPAKKTQPERAPPENKSSKPPLAQTGDDSASSAPPGEAPPSSPAPVKSKPLVAVPPPLTVDPEAPRVALADVEIPGEGTRKADRKWVHFSGALQASGGMGSIGTFTSSELGTRCANTCFQRSTLGAVDLGLSAGILLPFGVVSLRLAPLLRLTIPAGGAAAGVAVALQLLAELNFALTERYSLGLGLLGGGALFVGVVGPALGAVVTPASWKAGAARISLPLTASWAGATEGSVVLEGQTWPSRGHNLVSVTLGVQLALEP